MIAPPRHALAALGGRQPVVLVTGAASGIGLALARKLQVSGYRTVASARGSSLTRLSRNGFADSESFRILPLDVTDDGQRRELLRRVEGIWGGIDILINNAGIAFRGVVEHMSEEEELLQQATNYLGPMALCRLVLPHMRRQRWGRILNVSSVGGMMAMPTMSSYSASKFALEGATEALWYEMRPWNVRVSLVRPGFVNSDSFRNVYTPAAQQQTGESVRAYGAYYRHMTGFVERLMRRAVATPEDVADTILRAAARRSPKLRIAATADARLFHLLRRWLPRHVYHRLLYRFLPGVEDWSPGD